MGLSAIVRAWAYRKGVPVAMFSPQTVARHFVGNGGLKRKAKKAAVIAQCRKLGWHPADDNEADAAAVWDLMCSRLDANHAMPAQPHPLPKVGR
jgi:Holliday junction resolvasome RuvABC endonuclease subunit